METTASDWALYRGGRKQDGSDYDEAVAMARSGAGFVWMDLHRPDARRLARVATDFGLHPLAVDDAAEAHQMPKVQYYDDVVVVVFKTVQHAAPPGEVMVIVGAHFVVTVTHGGRDGVDRARSRTEAAPELLQKGPAAVLYAVADSIVDDYLSLAERLESDITDLEAAVFADLRGSQAEGIYRIKRRLLTLRRAVVPLAWPLRELTRRRLDVVPSAARTYLRDVADHLERARTLLVGQDEITTSMLEANLAQLSVAQNDDMRTITSWAAIIAVPTAIAGIYGMNFTDMPELHWAFGYPAVLVAMAAICVALYWNFKRRGWL